MKKILWILAGAEITILEKSSDQDKIRFSLMGLALIFLFIISFFSVYYILTLSTENIVVNISISLIWALLMTSLNRLIFMSLRGRNVSKLKNIYFIIPRLLLPTLIAIILSLPIQVKLFGGQIEEKIKEDRQKELLKTDSNYHSELSFLKKTKRVSERNYLEKLYGKDRDTIGRNFLALKLDMKIDSIDEVITKYISKHEIDRQKIISNKIGFILGLTTLNEIRKESTPVNFFYITIFVLILLIELLPIVLNIAYIDTTYENLLENEFKNSQYPIKTDANNTINQEADNEENTSLSEFQKYCNKMVNDVEIQIRKNTKKASELLRSALIIIILGISLYIGAIYYLMSSFFEKNEFKTYYIYFMISISILFLFSQFLGGWYLKQYRRSINISLYLNTLKSDLESYLLSYAIVCEFSKNTERKELIKELLMIINNTQNIDKSNGMLTSNDNDNYPNNIMSSISSILESINKAVNKK